MKAIDRLLQDWRISKVKPYIQTGSRVLDVGCGDGALFKQLGGLVGEGVGIDPTLDQDVTNGHYRLLKGHFPEVVPEGEKFDAITALAVFEHVPEEEQKPFAENCVKLLKDGGRILITVPAPFVDKILDVLMAVKLIDGMAVEEHHGFVPEDTPRIFDVPGLKPFEFKKFQLGLNNLFVFEKRAN